MHESLSALVDGELDRAALDALVVRLSEEPALSTRWCDYHLIGDVLRGTGSREIDAQRFRAKLAAEATVFAPRASRRLLPLPPLRRTLSAAAALAAVALVSWMAARSPVSETAPAEQLVNAVPAARGVEDYLLAHQRFSPSFAMQGTAPYVRLVDDSSNGDRSAHLRAVEGPRQ